MVKVKNLNKAFGATPIFKDLNFEVNKGDIVALIGPSGTGKSVLLRCLMDLEPVDSGNIEFDEDVKGNIGMVFQNFNLFGNMSVIENVASGLVDIKNMPKEDAFDRAMELLKKVGMADKAYAYPKTLSGGQQQRVAIARTLAMEPKLVLLDEPTSALDPLMRGEVESVIRLMADAGCTMMIATHEMDLVKKICNKVFFLNEGIVFEEGTPEKIFENPEKTQTKRFVRALRVLEFNVESKDFDFIGTQTAMKEFAYKNGVPKALSERLTTIMEELFQMVIIQPEEQNKMSVSFEYNEKDASLNGVVRFSGAKLDPDDPMYFFSWPIIVKRSSSVEVLDIDEFGYTNQVNIKIQ